MTPVIHCLALTTSDVPRSVLHVVLGKYLVASLCARVIWCEVIGGELSRQCLLIMMRFLFMVVERLVRVVTMVARVHDYSVVQIYCAHVF